MAKQESGSKTANTVLKAILLVAIVGVGFRATSSLMKSQAANEAMKAADPAIKKAVAEQAAKAAREALGAMEAEEKAKAAAAGTTQPTTQPGSLG